MDFSILAEIFGTIASIFLIFSVSRKKDSELIVLQGIANIFWLFHYIFFNSLTGVIASIFGILRNLFIFKYNSKRSKYIFMSIFSLSLIYNLFLVQNFINILPILAIFIISYGLIFKSENNLSSFLIIGNMLFLIFAIHLGSISATINYSLMILIIFYRIFKTRKII